MPDSTTSTGEEEEKTADDIRQEQKDKEQQENEEEEEEFHAHKGKIMGMKQYFQISSLSWDKSYDNPTATSNVKLHYDDNEREELIKYVYKGVSCKAKIRRSNEEGFTVTGLEEYDLSEEDIQEREHYPTKEQREDVGIEESLEELEKSSNDKRTAEQKEQDKAEENKPYTRQDGDGGIYGFITEVTHDDNGTELEIKDWGYCLEDNTKKLAFDNMPRSQILEEVIKSYGLVPVIDFTGLKDDMISWTNVTGSSSSNDDGTGSVTGDGSMTEEQAWQIARSFVYNHGTSTHEPQEAWDTLGDKPGGGVDCYSATAWLYYVYNMKIGIPARDICYHSDSASSGSHHTIQYFKNGQWIDPPEYDGVTTNLKVIKSRNKAEDHVCRSPPSGGSIPPYSRCPHSSNG